jgi:hypothetical protein
MKANPGEVPGRERGRKDIKIFRLSFSVDLSPEAFVSILFLQFLGSMNQ